MIDRALRVIDQIVEGQIGKISARIAVAAMIIGFFSVRRTGIYFAMLTFAFQMLLYAIALKRI